MSQQKLKRAPRDNFDGPWKDVLEALFEPFLGFLFPGVHAEIDWSERPEFLDKELQRLRRGGRRRGVDKLARVVRRSGEPARVLVHVEVQSQREPGFERRMFVYNYRLFDRSEEPVVSLAVLADTSLSWRPESYSHELCGCGVRMWFPVAKLGDLEARWEELENSDNPFAMVVMAHLKTQATRGRPQDRARWKLSLCRLLLERHWSRGDILNLYRFIDWLMALPRGLQREHVARVTEVAKQKEGDMPYLTHWEKEGLQKGLKQGKQEGKQEGLREAVLAALEERFGAVPEPVEQAVRGVNDPGLLSELLRLAIRAPSLGAFEAELRARVGG